MCGGYILVNAVINVISIRLLSENFGVSLLTSVGLTTTVVFLLVDVSGFEDDRRLLFLNMDLNEELTLLRALTESGPSPEPLVLTRTCCCSLFEKKYIGINGNRNPINVFFSVIPTLKYVLLL